MHVLPDLQAAFGDALHEAPPPVFWALFREPAAVAERRLAAYRRNVIGNWRSALASTYPVLAQRIGPQRFCALADQYIANCPSCNGDLNAYGGALAVLLETSALCEEFPYLPDMARLEWALLAAYGAADVAEFDFSALAAVPSAAQATLCFLIWSGAALIESPWPLVDIWQAHQLAPEVRNDAWAGVEPASSGAASCQALVVRVDGRVSVRALSVGEAAFLRALRSGQILAHAIVAALAEDAAFNPGAALQRLVVLRTLCGFQENENE